MKERDEREYGPQDSGQELRRFLRTVSASFGSIPRVDHIPASDVQHPCFTLDGVLYLDISRARELSGSSILEDVPFREGVLLAAYPKNRTDRSFSVPDGVSGIAQGAFNGCRLEDITLSDTVIFVGKAAFDNAPYLTTFRVPCKQITLQEQHLPLTPDLRVLGNHPECPLPSGVHAYWVNILYNLPF